MLGPNRFNPVLTKIVSGIVTAEINKPNAAIYGYCVVSNPAVLVNVNK